MTLEDAIKHCGKVEKEMQERANNNIQFERNGTIFLYDGEEYEKCCKCAEDLRQLAEWLKALQKIKAIIDIPNSVIQEDVIKYKMICEVVNEALGEVGEHNADSD